MTYPQIVMTVVVCLFILTVGLISLVWPEKMQRHALKYSTRFFFWPNPFLGWMKTPGYIMYLRFMGVFFLSFGLLILVLLLGNLPTAQPQNKPQQPKADQSYPVKQCTPRIVKKPSYDHKPIHIRKGEKSTGFTPLVAYDILESGEVVNVHLKRSSGIQDIDNIALGWIRSRTYNSRPGCGVIESQEGVTIDFH